MLRARPGLAEAIEPMFGGNRDNFLPRSGCAWGLLHAGARVNADTWQAEGYTPLSHDARTALMYAASRGSLAMIKLLLEAGADRQKADTKGRRAIDYLLGHGPVPPNPRLSEGERAEAARLLF